MTADLRIVPMTWGDACAFVGMWHRTHDEPIGHKFSIGVADDDDILRGVAVVGLPKPVGFNDGLTLEVNRTATDGTWNANSMLYGAAWRSAKSLGWRRLITYTEKGESGASLRAAGYRVIAERPPRGTWSSPSRPRPDHYCAACGRGNTEGIPRTLWEAS